MQLTWSIEGEEQLVRNLRIMSNEIKDWGPAFKEAGNRLKDIFSNDVFRTEGAAIGERWSPLKPQYLAQKVKQGFPADLLVKRGVMKNSFEVESAKDYAKISNTASYFKYHQSKDPRTKMPRRIMMKLGNPQKEIVVKIFHNYWYKKTHPK